METSNVYVELLTCSICLSSMNNTSGVNMCIQGHSVCRDCFNQLQKCPYCRSPWSRLRNRNIEQLIAETNQYQNDDLMDNENLKCPRCHNLMEGNIILCGGGHSICEGCVKGIYQCVVCPKLICYRRNFSLEKFIDGVKEMQESSSVKTPTQVQLRAILLKLLEIIVWFVGLFHLLKYSMYFSYTL